MNNIIRSDKKGKSGFTCITNEILQSKTLKAAEVGILVYLLSLPADYVIHKSTIWRQMRIGRDQFNNVWKELVRMGYIQTFKYKVASSKSNFYYRHVVYEIPVIIENQIECTQEDNSRILETSDWEIVPIQSNNTNDPASVSNHRNEVKVRHGQNEKDQILLDQPLLDEKTNVEEPSIVPHPQLRFGSVRDNQEDQQKAFSIGGSLQEGKPVPNIAKAGEQELTISRGNPFDWPEEFEPDENDIGDFQNAIDDLFTDKFPTWKKLLKSKPLHAFLQETSKVHAYMPEIIEMISILKKHYLK